jgi:uncharacterized membrane protein
VATTSRDPDRLVLFTDAVVAIAITLLILPLVDLVNEHKEHASELITDNWGRIWSFVLSFAVISRLWLVHHRTFEHVRAYNPVLMTVNMLWLFTVVLLPFPTGMIDMYGKDRFAAAFYVATVLASSVCQCVMILIIHRRPEIQSTDNPLRGRNVASAVTTTTMLVVAFLLTALVPGVTYYSLLLLLLAPFILMVWERLRGSVREQ